MKTYRIWILWADRSEDSGATFETCSPERAIERAHYTGLVSGFGYRRNYVGLHAQEVTHA